MVSALGGVAPMVRARQSAPPTLTIPSGSTLSTTVPSEPTVHYAADCWCGKSCSGHRWHTGCNDKMTPPMPATSDNHVGRNDAPEQIRMPEAANDGEHDANSGPCAWQTYLNVDGKRKHCKNDVQLPMNVREVRQCRSRRAGLFLRQRARRRRLQR